MRNLCAMVGLDFRKPVTFFVGENGIGKSTLNEAIAVHAGFNAEGSSQNFNFSAHASCSDLYHYITLSRSIERNTDGFFLRAESFLSLVEHRFRGHGLYILDEPEAANSPILMTLHGAEIYELTEDDIRAVRYQGTERVQVTKQFLNARSR
ncbi:MAG: AAA family ATPase [Oscillospiraceae bacterium]|nr:AAA family ATPase [Oscillospiraceae bacterium]